MELGYLKYILNDLISRFSHVKSLNNGFLKRELIHLGEMEKKLVKKKILACKYDLGALSVLILLKETGILNVCEFLDNIKDSTELLQIITDIFDDDTCNSAILIEEILAENKYTEEVSEVFKNYVDDVLENSEVIKTEMMIALEENLSKETFSRIVLPKFLNIIMKHPFKKCSSVIDVLNNQKKFNEKFKTMKMLTTVIERLMKLYSDTIFEEMMMMLMKSDDELNWFFALLLINFITDDQQKIIKSKFLLLQISNSFHYYFSF